MQKLSEIIAPDHIALDVEVGDIDTCLRDLVARLVSVGDLSENLARRLDEALHSREKLGATCVGHGVVIPHAYVDGLTRSTVFFARLGQAIPYEAPDGQPVDLVFLLTGPVEAQREHLPMLARIVRLLHDRRLLDDLRQARDARDIVRAIGDVERRHA